VLDALVSKDVFTPKGSEMEDGQRERLETLNTRMKRDFSQMSDSEKENFWDKFYNDYIYNSNSIEGSTLSKDETFSVTHDGRGVKGKKLKEIYMARNLMSAIKFMTACRGAPDVNLAKKLHAIVQENIQPRDELGEFKRRQNYITGTDFLPTPPSLVNERMRGLMRWYGLNKNKFHPFELAALFHIKFVSIHPFIDGNGRTARLLHNHILNEKGFAPLIYRTDTKQDYYSALRSAQTYGSHRQFLDYTAQEFVATYEGY